MSNVIETPNGERYPRVGGTRERYFAGTDLQPHKLPENAATPTRRVHAVLGGIESLLQYFLNHLLYLREAPFLSSFTRWMSRTN